MRNIIIALLSTTLLATAAFADEVQIREDAPDRYVVVKGDTLWGISGRFLKSPWRWPEVWKLNQDQIKNPHRIYPGDVVLLENGSLRLLRNEKYQGRQFEKRSPQTRIEATEHQAIPVISPADIGPFLSQPLVIEKGGLEKAPRIIANEESRVAVGAGSRAYVMGITQGGPKLWHIFRPGPPLKDPDSGAILAYEATYVGDVRVTKYGEPATVEIIKALQEVTREDRLVAASSIDLANIVPHAPDRQIKGKIISAYGSLFEVARGFIVAVNVGTKQGMELGHVLAISRAGKVADYRSGEGKKTIKLPEERIGLVLLFRTFDNISYGLVVKSDLPILVGDAVMTP